MFLFENDDVIPGLQATKHYKQLVECWVLIAGLVVSCNIFVVCWEITVVKTGKITFYRISVATQIKQVHPDMTSRMTTNQRKTIQKRPHLCEVLVNDPATPWTCRVLPTFGPWWRLGLVVPHWSRSTKLLYAGPGLYWDGLPSAGG